MIRISVPFHGSIAAFTLGRGPAPGAGPAQVRVFTLHFADSHFSGRTALLTVPADLGPSPD